MQQQNNMPWTSASSCSWRSIRQQTGCGRCKNPAADNKGSHVSPAERFAVLLMQ